MDLLPKSVYRVIRPAVQRKNLLKWHMWRIEKHTGMLSTAVPLTAILGLCIGLGVLIIDKQSELAFYRQESIGVRELKIEEEHQQLIRFMKQKYTPKEEVEMVPVPQI